MNLEFEVLATYCFYCKKKGRKLICDTCKEIIDKTNSEKKISISYIEDYIGHTFCNEIMKIAFKNSFIIDFSEIRVNIRGGFHNIGKSIRITIYYLDIKIPRREERSNFQIAFDIRGINKKPIYYNMDIDSYVLEGLNIKITEEGILEAIRRNK